MAASHDDSANCCNATKLLQKRVYCPQTLAAQKQDSRAFNGCDDAFLSPHNPSVISNLIPKCLEFSETGFISVVFHYERKGHDRTQMIFSSQSSRLVSLTSAANPRQAAERFIAAAIQMNLSLVILSLSRHLVY